MELGSGSENIGIGADGITGEYAPEPLEEQVPRTRRFGLGMLQEAPEMSRSQHNQAVREGKLASVHSWELVTAVDGPGTRLTLFLSGCPLRCQYCHNPDTFRCVLGMQSPSPMCLSW